MNALVLLALVNSQSSAVWKDRRSSGYASSVQSFKFNEPGTHCLPLKTVLLFSVKMWNEPGSTGSVVFTLNV